MKVISVLILAVTVAACASYSAIDTNEFRIGMSRVQASNAMGGRTKAIGANQYKHGVVEVVQVDRRSHWDSTVAERYYLYFLNDKLEKWGRPGDWRKEADQVYEIRYR